MYPVNQTFSLIKYSKHVNLSLSLLSVAIFVQIIKYSQVKLPIFRSVSDLFVTWLAVKSFYM